MKLQDPRNLESFTSMWNRATAAPVEIQQQDPRYRSIWPELAPTKPLIVWPAGSEPEPKA